MGDIISKRQRGPEAGYYSKVEGDYEIIYEVWYPERVEGRSSPWPRETEISRTLTDTARNRRAAEEAVRRKQAEEKVAADKATNINSQGEDLSAQGKYQAAEQKYSDAARTTTNASDREKYTNNQAGAINSQGEDLSAQGKHQAAEQMYIKAASTTTNAAHREKYTNNQAGAINSQGLDLTNQGKHQAAEQKYSDAARITKDATAREKYTNNQAGAINSQGLDLSNQGKHQAAEQKYSDAARITKDATAREKYTNNQASAINSQGLDLSNQGKHQAAEQMYIKAASTTTKATDRENYTNNQASAINSQGLDLSNQGKHQAAEQMYIKAASTTTKATDRENYTNNQAGAINSQGLDLMSKGHYGLAKNSFNEALKIANKQELKDSINKNVATITAHDWGTVVGGVYGGDIGGKIGNYLGEKSGTTIGGICGYQNVGLKIGKFCGAISGAAIGGQIGATAGSLLSQKISDQVINISGIRTVGTTIPALVSVTTIGGAGLAICAIYNTSFDKNGNTFFKNLIEVGSATAPVTLVVLARSIPIIGEIPPALGLLSYSTREIINYYKYGTTNISAGNIAKTIIGSTVSSIVYVATAAPLTEIFGTGLSIIAVPIVSTVVTGGVLKGLSYGTNTIQGYYYERQAIKFNKQGINLLKKGKEKEEICKEAIKKFDLAINYNNLASYNANKAKAFNKLKNYSEAIKASDQALTLDVSYEDAKKQKAHALYKQGKEFNKANKHTEAVKKYKEALKFSISDKYYSNLAKSYSYLEKFDKAGGAVEKARNIREYQYHNKHTKALKIMPDNSDTLQKSFITKNIKKEENLLLKNVHIKDSYKSKKDIRQSSQIEKKSNHKSVEELLNKQSIKQKFEEESLDEVVELNKKIEVNTASAQQKEAEVEKLRIEANNLLCQKKCEAELTTYEKVAEITVDNRETLKNSIEKNIEEGTELLSETKYKEALQYFVQADKEFKELTETNEKFNIDLKDLQEQIEEINSVLEYIKNEARKDEHQEMNDALDLIITPDILTLSERSKQFIDSNLLLGINQHNNQDILGGIDG